MNKNMFSNISLVFCSIFLMTSSSLSAQRYFIAAATSGLGESICALLANAGHSLVLGGRDENKLNLLKKSLEDSYHGECSIELFDYKNLSSIARVGKNLEKNSLDGIVIIPARFSLSTNNLLSASEWREMFDVGFIAPLELIKELLPASRDGSSIVIVDGLTSVCYIPEYKNLNVLRKMWIAEIKNLIYQFADRTMRVNALSPGVILTEYHTQRVAQRALKAGRTVKEQLKLETKNIPLNKHGQPQDIAQATLFLLSASSAHINGINLVIDGGLSCAY